MLFDLQRALWVAFFHTAERLIGSAAAAQIQDSRFARICVACKSSSTFREGEGFYEPLYRNAQLTETESEVERGVEELRTVLQ